MSGRKEKNKTKHRRKAAIGLEKRPCSKAITAAAAAAASIVSWPLRLVVKKKKGTCMVVHVKAIRCFS